MSNHTELVARLGDILERVDGIELQVPHDTGLPTLEPRKVARIRALLGDSAEVLSQVVAAFDTAEAPAEAPSIELAPRELADLAFVGRLELDQLRETLEAAVAEGKPWRVVADADRAVTRVVRALAPIEGALRRRLGLEAIERRWFDLDDALASRGHYAALWLATERRQASVEAADADGVTAHLEELARSIETLRRDDLYPFLRVDDRLGIRRLQKRILEHLGAGDGESAGSVGARGAGVRLWQDAASFFRLLMQISRREELREHDLHLAARLCAELAEGAAVPDELPRALHERLLQLACQDSELDDLLARSEPGPTADYRAPLARIRDRLLGR
ncbi:MAG: hypothetical protein AAGC60_06265 [Acidobacteriota bacterium]